MKNILLAFLVAAPAALRAAAPAGATFPASPSLDDCLRLAVENSPSLRIARDQIREQEGVDIEIRSADLPSLGLQAGATYTDEERQESFGPSIAPSQEAWSAGLRVSYNVYAGGSVTASRAGQQERIAAARAGFESALATTVMKVRTDFYGALLARSRIAVREEAVQLNEQQLKLARNRFDSGAGSQFEVLRAEVTLSNARPPLIRAREEHRTAIDQLRQTVGVPFAPGQGPGDIDLKGGWDIPGKPFELDGLLDLARKARADIRRAEALVAASRHAVDAAAAGRRPRVDLYGDYGVRSSMFSADADELKGYEVGAQASWPIWDAGATKGRVQQAETRLSQAETAREEMLMSIEQEVRNAHSNWQVSAEILRTSDDVIRQAQEALRLAQARFEAGAGTQIDVLSSQLELIQARLEKDSAAHNLLVAVAQLRKAVGDSGLEP